jgi:hypothetical protein
VEEALTREPEPEPGDVDGVGQADRIAVDPSAIRHFVVVLARILVARTLREEIAQKCASV